MYFYCAITYNYSMKTIFLTATAALLFSCSNKDEQFCNCLKASDQLNAKTQTVYNKLITQKLQKEIQQLKSVKVKACEDYQMMSGKEMIELKKECN